MFDSHIADTLICKVPQDLPIADKAAEIRTAIIGHPVTIVCGSTGSGKTTQIPKIALSAGCGRRGRIGCTQPRRIAAASLARRVSEEMGTECGDAVGYQVRFDNHSGPRTVVKFMTDGILLAETRNDPLLRKYDCLILDEVHERSLNIDFLLGFLKNLLEKRDDLKVIISSATLEAERIAAFFNGAPIIELEGRIHPIEDVFLPPEGEEELTDHVARGVDYLTEIDSHGDILVFLPAEQEIRDCAKTLIGRGYPHTEVLLLFGRLSVKDQQKVFQRSPLRRIVLSTNVAETSLTIPGIRYVVDSGLVRLSRYNPRSRIQELRFELVSQASARQRRGRCGRLSNGICVHLYSEEGLKESSEFTPPEIQRSSLAGVILQMASLNLPPLGTFPLVDEPSGSLIREGMRTLTDIRAIDKEGRITRTGWILADMPIDPQLGKMLMEAARHGVVLETAIIAAFLSIPDVRERPFEKAFDADIQHERYDSKKSDYIGILQLWVAIDNAANGKGGHRITMRKFCTDTYLNYKRVREWRSLVEDLIGFCEDQGFDVKKKIDLALVPYDLLHMTVLSGIPRQMAFYDKEVRAYVDMTSRKSYVFPGSGLIKRQNPAPWILFFANVETIRVFSRFCAEVKPEWLEIVAPHLCAKVYDRPEWDPVSGYVYCRERITAGALPIHPGRRKHYGSVDPVKAREIFIREGLVTGIATLPGTWLKKFHDNIRKLRVLEQKIRRPDGLVDEEAIRSYFEEHLPADVNSVKDIEKRWKQHPEDLCPDTWSIIRSAFQDIREDDYPDGWSESGQTFPILYHYDPGEKQDGITIRIPEDSLPSVNPFILEYLVPGYLYEKVEMILRNLPKQYRQELVPVHGTAERFVRDRTAGKVFREQPLSEALSNWLADNMQVDVAPDELKISDLPEYLKMKLAIVNDRNNVSRVVYEFPEEAIHSSVLTARLPAARRWTAADCADWPDLAGRMPEKVLIEKDSDTYAYPALTDEKTSIGRKLFLKEEDARISCRRGMIRLYRMRLPTLVHQLEKSLKFSRNVMLTFFLEYPEWKEDMADNAIAEALGDLWELRSAAEFHAALENSRDTVADILDRQAEEIEKFSVFYEEIRQSLRRLPADSFSEIDIENHLELFFRKGFLKTPQVLKQYPRYLKGLRLRARRAAEAPGKDEKKADFLPEFMDHLFDALEEGILMENRSDVADYFMLLEEACLSRFAPEVPPVRKCGREKLEEAWKLLRI